jgi:hypothetical protein
MAALWAGGGPRRSVVEVAGLGEDGGATGVM